MLSAVGIVLLLAANAFFVAAEFALVKVRGSRIADMAEAGSARARLTLRILHDLEAYLAACQLGITMASLGLGWLGEPAVAALLQPLLEGMGIDHALLHPISFVVGFLVFSSLHIVIGEQVPKTLAIRKPEPMSLWVALPLHAFFLCCYPLNWALNRASRAVLRLFKVAEASHIEVYSGQELRGLIGNSRRHGAMRKLESDMLGGILDLGEVEVGEVMTHRKDMVSIDAATPLAEVVRFVQEKPFTRYPMWRGDPDTIVGVLHAKDLLSAVFRAGPEAPSQVRLADIAAAPWFIPDTTSLGHQLLAFRQRRAHLAIVVDEYGALQGLVTLEDIIEEIIGEFTTAAPAKSSAFAWDDAGSALVEGASSLRELNRKLGLALPIDGPKTLNGLILEHLQDIPEAGVSLKIRGIPMEVVQTQDRVVKTVRLFRPEPAPATAESA